jgi:hypothetical protein
MTEKMKIIIEVDGNQAKATIDGVTKDFKSLGDEAKKSGDAAGDSFLSMAGKMRVGALAIAATAYQTSKFAADTINAADAIQDMSNRTGISASTLKGFELIAKQSGASLEDLGVGLRFLSRYIGDADLGNKKFEANLKLLGITAKDPIQAFYQLSDAVKRIEDPSKRAAILSDLLGRSYQTLVPLMSEGGRKIAGMVEQQKRLNPEFDAFAKRADLVNDRLAVLAANLDRVKIAATDAMLAMMPRSWTTSVADQMRQDIKRLEFELKRAGKAPPIVAMMYGTKEEIAAELAVLRKELAKIDESEKPGKPLEITAPEDEAKAKAKAEAAKRLAIAVNDEKNKWTAIAQAIKDSTLEGEAALTAKYSADYNAMATARNRFEETHELSLDKIKEIDAKFDVAKLQLGETYELNINKLRADASLKSVEAEDERMGEQWDKENAHINARIELQQKLVDMQSATAQAGLSLQAANISASSGMELASIEADKAIKEAQGIWTLDRELAFQQRKAEIKTEAVTSSGVVKAELATIEYDQDILQFDRDLEKLRINGEITAEAQKAIDDAKILRKQEYYATLNTLGDAVATQEISSGLAVKSAKIAQQGDLTKAVNAFKMGEYSTSLMMGAKMLEGQAKHSKAAFEANKILTLSSAAIKLPSMVINAYNDGLEAGGPLGPVVGAAYAAVALGIGLANISAIQSSQFGGGAGASPSAGGTAGTPASALPGVSTPTAPTTPAAAAPTLNIIVNAPAGLVDPVVAQQLADSLAPHLSDSFRRGFNTTVTA